MDFSTGNIDFEGDVRVLKGIRDIFEVRATGNIEVGGLIEASTIDAGGSVFAKGGMAGARGVGGRRCDHPLHRFVGVGRRRHASFRA